MGKDFKVFQIAIVVFLAVICWRSPGEAFHSGGNGECLECHMDMRGSLRGSDASSTCLRCHQAPQGTRKPTGSYIATSGADLRAGAPPSQLTPGGDFGYVKVTYSWKTSGGQTETSPGERHGHNIIALDYGYEADGKNLTAPGGVYPSDRLSCTSCHDPHSKISKDPAAASAYRMLGGIGYTTPSVPGMAFTVDPPVAVAPRNYNRSEAQTDTRVAYGKGMSEWCSNCHASSQIGSGHPTGAHARFTMEIISNYNAYLKSGDINGRSETSYTSLVPFEEGTEDRIVLAQHANTDGSYLQGPDSSSTVMCLTCHRAHASGWDTGARWSMSSTFFVQKGIYPGTDNGSPAKDAQGRTAAQAQKAFYDRPSSLFASYQRVLCNKCHVRD